MTPAARLSAAIEIVADIEAQRRPAADVLKDWGLSHRFAGSSDRAAIAGLVYDTLRRKSSSAWLMGEDSARAAAIGMLHRERGLAVDDNRRIVQRRALCAGTVDGSRAGGTRRRRPLGSAPAHVARRLSRMARSAFRACVRRRSRRRRRRACEPGAARSARQYAQGRARRGPAQSSNICMRSHAMVATWPAHQALGDAKNPAIHAEPAFLKGTVEVQDEGSQLAALLSRRQARRTGRRSRRRRRRQDAGAGGHDRQSRPDLRDRHRQAAAGADPRAHHPRRRSQYSGADAARRSGCA